jgi:hypothetical protein
VIAMIALNGQVGELGFTVQITRADTGKVETYQMVGRVTEEEVKALQEAGLVEPQPKEK